VRVFANKSDAAHVHTLSPHLFTCALKQRMFDAARRNRMLLLHWDACASIRVIVHVPRSLARRIRAKLKIKRMTRDTSHAHTHTHTCALV
jgi:hypothetical protein